MIDFYYPERVECERAGRTDIETFIEAVKTVLQHWLDVHTDPHAWASGWSLQDERMLETLAKEGKVENNYFTFDLREAVLKAWAKRNIDDFEQCHGCNLIIENGQECDCEYEGNDPDLHPVDLENLVYWLEDIYYNEIPSFVTVEDIFEALKTEGFEAYREGVAPLTESIEEEIELALLDIEEAETPAELIAAVLQATQIYHVNGSIIEDYSEEIGLSFALVDDIRNEGLEAIFGAEEVADFMNSFNELEEAH